MGFKEPKVNVSARIPAHVREEIEDIAMDRGVSVSSVAETAILNGLSMQTHGVQMVDLTDEAKREIAHQILLELNSQGGVDDNEDLDSENLNLEDNEDEGSAFPALPEHEALRAAIRYLEKKGKSIPTEYLADVCILFALKNRFLLGDSIDRFLDGKGLAQIDVQTLDEWRQEVLKKFK